MAYLPINGTPPSEWLEQVFAQSGAVLLHTADPNQPEARSLLFTHPVGYITAMQPAEVPASFSAIQAALDTGHHVAGYLTYEAGLALHELPAHSLPAAEPLLCFGIYRAPQVYSGPLRLAPLSNEQKLNLAPFPTITRDHYNDRITRIQQWIAAGDIYQANYTFPLSCVSSENAQAIYQALLVQQPAACAAVLRLAPPGLLSPELLSFSPELFFQTAADGTISTQPMKGTVARSGRTAADADAVAWLASDPKNRAEHVMIVDLLRNDLGRVCQTGSVRTDHLFHVRTLPTIHQMVSDVSGQLRPGTSWLQVFRALFPSGSVTGAPKLRAMQLLHQVENAPRGVYTGAIGYIAPSGESCFSVAIRTLALRPVAHQQEVTCGVGGGIVADSSASGEYEEALLKASFIRHAAKPLELIETVLCNDGTLRWLETHLDRLQRTAESLHFPFSRQGARHHVRAATEALARGMAHRVRLTLEATGEFQTRTEPLSSWPASLRVRLAQQRSHLGDPALAHKSNMREGYDQEFDLARNAGFDEAIFANDAGLLTEACVTNVFYVLDGRVFTPYEACGVLPGVLRTQLLRHKLITESLLPLTSLDHCEAVLLGNSLRGIYPVRSLQVGSDRALEWDPTTAGPYLQHLQQVFATE